MHDTAHVAITYWRRVCLYFGTSEGSTRNVHRSDGFEILIWLSSSGRGQLIQKCWLTKRYLSAGAADKFWETKKPAIYKTTGHDRPIVHKRVFSLVWYRTLPGPFLGGQLHMKILSLVALSWHGFVMVSTSASFSDLLHSSPIPNTHYYHWSNSLFQFLDKSTRIVKVMQSHYRPEVAQRVPES